LFDLITDGYLTQDFENFKDILQLISQDFNTYIHNKMVARSIAVLILVVACASVQARSPISGVIKQIMEKVRTVPHIPHLHAKKIEVVYKAGEVTDNCPTGQDCGYPDGCCPKVVNDCSSDDWVDDQDKLFICCDPCTGNVCGTSIWACEQDAENSLACQNRNKMRFLKTIQL